MKIKLINPGRKPEWGESFWDCRSILEMAGVKAYGIHLALPVLASLTPPDIEVSIIDENVEYLDLDENVDLVGITGYTCFILRAYEIADAYRLKDIPVVIGGIHASMMPDEALEHADSVVIGEAEEIWPELLEDFKNGSLQRIYRAESQPSLQNAIVPKWEKVNTTAYSNFTIQTGRGCPYDCEFCSVHVMNGRKCRHKPIEVLIKEIKSLKRINDKKTFFIADDNFLAVPRYAKDFLEEIKPLNIKFTIQASIDRLNNDQMLDLLSDAGCIMAFIGFESISQKSLDAVNKSKVNDVGRYKEIVEKIHSSGIEIMGSFIIGLDNDDKSTFIDINDFIKEANILFAMINILTPLPGTNLYDEFKADCRITRNKWYYYNAENVCIKHSSLDENELLGGRTQILRSVYSYRSLHRKFRYLAQKGAYEQYPRSIKGAVGLLFASIMERDLKRAFFILRNLWGPYPVSIGSLVFALALHDYVFSDDHR